MTDGSPGSTRNVDPGTINEAHLVATVYALASPENTGRRVGTPRRGGRRRVPD